MPKPLTPGGPPVLIGGSGERKTLRMVAQYADACNVFGQPEDVRRLMGVLDEHCASLGRDPARCVAHAAGDARRRPHRGGG